ncbi:MAG: hypothetical protein ACRCSR_11600 [Bacteroidales bacterium]
MIPSEDATRKDQENKDIIPVEDNQPDEKLSNENDVILGDEVPGASTDEPQSKKNLMPLIIMAIVVLLFLLLVIKTCYS